MLAYLLHTDSFQNADAGNKWEILKKLHFPENWLGPRPPSKAETALALGATFSCLLHSGKVECWGTDGKGHKMEAPQFLKQPRSLVAGNDFACVVEDRSVAEGGSADTEGSENAKVRCWGSDLGPLAEIMQTMSTVDRPLHLMSGTNALCAQTQYDGLICHGLNHFTLDSLFSVPNALGFVEQHRKACIENDKEWVCMEERPDIIVARKSKRSYLAATIAARSFCYLNLLGELDCENAEDRIELPNARLMASNRSGSNFCLASDNQVTCRQNAWFGEKDFPPAVQKPLLLEAGYEHFCLVDAVGVKCWGQNSSGQSNVPAHLRRFALTGAD